MIEACELYDKKANIVVFGIVPADILSAKIGLSKPLDEKFEEIVQQIVKDLKKILKN